MSVYVEGHEEEHTEGYEEGYDGARCPDLEYSPKTEDGFADPHEKSGEEEHQWEDEAGFEEDKEAGVTHDEEGRFEDHVHSTGVLYFDQPESASEEFYDYGGGCRTGVIILQATQDIAIMATLRVAMEGNYDYGYD
ncbi:hypothetical protein NMY22_g7473 [Coprinellus aureogranulatus]|nr:hypothetical protein NMY22_g7473 [Coprinellus aureogranulatus]